VNVIAALVEGARTPAEHELPVALRPLTRRNACERSDARWDYDVDVLERRLRQVLGESTIGYERVRVTDPAREHGQAEMATTTLLSAIATLAAVACAALVLRAPVAL
jgi:hypothetical protein